MRSQWIGLVGWIVVCVWMSGCGDSSPHHEEKHSLLNKIEAAQEKPSGYGIDPEAHLHGLRKTLVRGFDWRPPFYVKGRVEEVKQFPCSTCHTVSINKLKSSRKGARRAHWNIKLKHAPKLVMTCATCHNTSQMDQFVTTAGNVVDFDQDYQVCAQCHFNQANDWAGGAHGMRVGGWAGTRVVVNCTGCHSPHSPGYEKRWPSIVSRLPGELR